MNLAALYLAFFKVGLVAYGGGYAMIPLFQRELVASGWLTLQEFLDVVAISEMTPGPIAINTATFVGYRLFGPRSSRCHFGSHLPILILTFVLIYFLNRYRDHKITGKLMSGIQVAVVILIVSAALYILPSAVIDSKTALLAIATFILMTRTKLSPILLIFLGGMAGILLNF